MRRISLALILGIGFLSLLALAAQTTPHAVAQNGLQPLAQFTLPPRATGTPTAAPTGAAVAAGTGTILLRLQTTRNDLWSAVQWQDGFGGWHTVESWQGYLYQPSWGQSSDRWQVWGVATKDLNSSGTFRWVVYNGKGGAVLLETASFKMPGANEMRIAGGVVK